MQTAQMVRLPETNTVSSRPLRYGGLALNKADFVFTFVVKIYCLCLQAVTRLILLVNGTAMRAILAEER
jgi:hypothetical protein